MTTMGWVVLGVGGWVLFSVLVALVMGWMIRLRDQQVPYRREYRERSEPSEPAAYR